MRIVSIALCLSILMLLCGCGDLLGTETTEPENATLLEETVPENRDTVIDTPYYCLTIPESWGEDYSYSTSDNSDGSYTLRFSEKSSIEEYGGHLFSIRLMPETEDYTYYPSYNVLGSIETKQAGSFNVVVIYPTDVQFAPEAAQKYMAMQADIPEILGSITYHDCTYTQKSIPIEAVV